MELISTDDFFILQHLQRSETSLWVCRKTGKFVVRPPWELADQENPECLGLVWGIYGKLEIHPEVPQRLVLVRRCDRVGEIPGPKLKRNAVYRVGDVVLLPLVPPSHIPADAPLSQQLGLKPCPKHQGGVVEHPDFRSETDAQGKLGGLGGRILGAPLKLLSSDPFKSATSENKVFSPFVKSPWKSTNRMVERFERRILEEFSKMFNDSNSFYFSLTGDVTNSLQRQVARPPIMSTNAATGEQIELFPTWREVDERFFFNKAMVQELIEIGDQRLDAWITPFIQGYVEIKECPLDLSDSVFDGMEAGGQLDAKLPDFYTIILISRRSRYRAGTRYKRRGVDPDGHVANYVETEQILLYHHYALSFLQVRGSVPLYWSQPGIRYRPPPKLDATPDEDLAAFTSHFNQEYSVYDGPITCVSLVEKSGREKVIGDAYMDNALALNRADLNFVYFDFHEYCRGMKFENVNILIQALEEDYIKAMRYCWLDKHGVVCQQRGVFRVNCIDCLDRTNVVQTAIAKTVLENQLIKLGLIPPEAGIPHKLRSVFQGLWANNGDALSKQYAGTNALKGDFTRTGERNLSGLMKDGMNSASRYYLNQFRDAYRQAAIDIITGQIVSESLMSGQLEGTSTFYEDTPTEEENAAETAEHVRSIIEDCKKLLIPDMNSIIGAWGLIDNDIATGDPSQEDMDVIVILTKDSYYIAHYDDEVDKVTSYQRVALSDIEMIEYGLQDHTFNLLKQSKGSYTLRISYRMPPPPSSVFYNGDNAEPVPPSPASLNAGNNLSGYFHALRACNLRFFNSMAVVVTTNEERLECLKSVADSLIVAMELAQLPPAPMVQGGKLERRKSKLPEMAHSNFGEQTSSNAASSASSKVVSGSLKALSSVTSHFSRLNPISKFRQQSASPASRGASSMMESENIAVVPQINIDQQKCDEDGESWLSKDPGDQEKSSNPTVMLTHPSAGDSLSSSNSPKGGDRKKFPTLLSPLLSPTTSTGISGGASPSGGQYSSTSRLNEGQQSTLSPSLNRKGQKLSRSSEDLVNHPKEVTAGLRNVASKFLGVVELDTVTGDLHVRGGSLQKDLDVATHVLEEGAVETAAIIEKGVLNPFSKLTKGLGAVLKGQSEITTNVISDQDLDISPTRSASASQNNQVANQLLKAKIDQANSLTQVFLL